MARVALITLFDKGALGVRYLSSALRAGGHEASIIYFKEYTTALKKHSSKQHDPSLHEGICSASGRDIVFAVCSRVTRREVELLVNVLRSISPQLVGFSLATTNLNLARTLTEAVKRDLAVPVVWGGIGVTVEPDRCVEYADVLCLGEGEEAMAELASRIDLGKDYDDVPNLWMKRDGKVIRNVLRPLIQDLDDLPFPDFEERDKYFIERDTVSVNEPFINNDIVPDTYTIMTSRGCPFSCSYCCNAYYREIYRGQKYLRRRTVDNVIEELVTARKKLGFKFVTFYDEVFTFSETWLQEFTPKYKKHVGMPFWCNMSPRHVTCDALDLLKDAGLRSATIGIQSGSEYILKEVFNRPTTNREIKEAVARIVDSGVRCYCDLITNNPFEREIDREYTLNLLLDLRKPVSLQLSKLSFFPNSEIALRLQQEGVDRKVDERTYSFYNKMFLLVPILPARAIGLLRKSTWVRRYPGILSLFFHLNRTLNRFDALLRKVLADKSYWTIRRLSRRLKYGFMRA